MNKQYNLNVNSTLAELELHQASIDISTRVTESIKLLERNIKIPGIILVSNNKFKGMISRRRLHECLSKPYSRELYIKRTLEYLIESQSWTECTIFQASTLISDATAKCLERNDERFYEPIVVQYEDADTKLLDIHDLLIAQSKVHMVTVKSLREANEFKSEILNIAVHDLKNPLNSIMGFTSLIKSGIATLPETIEMAEIMHNSSERMLNLINMILDSSSLEQGKMEIRKAAVKIYKLAHNVVINNQTLVAKKEQNIIFHSELDEEFEIEVDKSRIMEAMDNLVSNAIKYSPIKKPIKVGLRKVPSKIQFYVSDKGPGIKNEEKMKLFGKFQRLSNKPTGGESSNGLGLYIVKQTIQLHNGNIWVETEPGKGSTFVFELPAGK